MYVIVEIAGQQFKAEKGRKLYVHPLFRIQMILIPIPDKDMGRGIGDTA